MSLQVNRLSGAIPSALTEAQEIHLVDGNMFSCGIIDRSALPTADPAADNYQCGSNILDLAMYLFGGMLLGISVVLLVLLRWNQAWKDNILELYNSCAHCEIPNLKIFNQDLRILIKFASVIALLVVMILLPIYAGLNSQYSTYTMKYAWTLSAAYLSGITPGAVLLCLFLAMVASVTVLAKQRACDEDKTVSQTLTKGSLQYVAGIFVLNLVIVLGVNIFYIYVLQQSQSQLVSFIAALFVALFKLVWMEQSLPYLFRSVNATVLHRTCAQLFNFFVVPLSVLAVISPNCFYYAVANSEPVSATVDFYVCQYFTPNGSCLSFEYEPIESSYTPPFVYNYQCTSTFIIDYSSVYVYMYVISGLVSPLLFSALQYLSTHGQPSCIKLLPNVHKPPSHDVIDQPNVVILNRDVLQIRIVTSLSLLLTLGVVVPLLSIVVLVYMVTSTVFIQLSLGRLLKQTDNALQKKYESVLNRECVQVLNSIQSVLWIVVLFACLFYAIVLWDIVGDRVGLVAALWAPLLMVLVPFIYFFGLFTLKRKKAGNSTDKETEMAFAVKVAADEVKNPIV